MSKINTNINPGSLPKIVSSLRFAIDTYITKSIEKAGVKGLVSSHGNILVQLYAKDRQTMATIAQNIGRCKSTLTVLVDKLEKVGFITREADKVDTRVKNLCLTEEGKNFQSKFWEISQDLNNIMWKDFTEEEKVQCIQFLNRVSQNISSTFDRANTESTCR